MVLKTSPKKGHVATRVNFSSVKAARLMAWSAARRGALRSLAKLALCADLVPGLFQRAHAEPAEDRAARTAAVISKPVPFVARGEDQVAGHHRNLAVFDQMRAGAVKDVEVLVAMVVLMQQMRAAGFERALPDDERSGHWRVGARQPASGHVQKSKFGTMERNVLHLIQARDLDCCTSVGETTLNQQQPQCIVARTQLDRLVRGQEDH